MTTPNANIPITLVGSNFHDSFVDSLKTNQRLFTTGTLTAFTEYTALVDEHEARVLVLNGHNSELAEAATLTTLLDQSIILAFFAPSKEILDALQQATKCLLHIPSINLEDGTPLIMHRRPHDGLLSITPGFSIPTESPILYLQDSVDGDLSVEATTDSKPTPIPTPAILTPEEKLVMNFGRSVEIIQRTVEYHLELLHGDRPMEQDYLTPDVGTQFYKSVEITRNDTARTHSPDFQYPFVPGNDQEFQYYSRLRLHAYCADAKPRDEDFSQNGRVYLFAVLSGQVNRRNARNIYNVDWFSNSYWFVDSASYRITPGILGMTELVGEAVQPQSGTTNGDVSSYNINFERRINLWKSDNLYSFTAKYADNFDHKQFKQKVSIQRPGVGQYEVLVYYSHLYDKTIDNADWKYVFTDKRQIKDLPEDNIPLRAFFAWSTTSLVVETISDRGTLTFSGFQSFIGSGDGRFLATTQMSYPLVIIPGGGYKLDLTPGSWPGQ